MRRSSSFQFKKNLRTFLSPRPGPTKAYGRKGVGKMRCARNGGVQRAVSWTEGRESSPPGASARGSLAPWLGRRLAPASDERNQNTSREHHVPHQYNSKHTTRNEVHSMCVPQKLSPRQRRPCVSGYTSCAILSVRVLKELLPRIPLSIVATTYNYTRRAFPHLEADVGVGLRQSQLL